MARAARNVTRDIQSYIKKYSRYHQSVLSIEQFTHFGKHFHFTFLVLFVLLEVELMKSLYMHVECWECIFVSFYFYFFVELTTLLPTSSCLHEYACIY